MKKPKIYRCKPCKKKFGTDYAKFLRHRRKHHAKSVAKSHDASQRNQYGQTSEEYYAQLKKQNNRCICGRKAKNVGLHQEHCHKIAKLKIRVVWDGKGKSKLFTAINDEYRYSFTSHNRKKAVRMVRLKLKRKSRRGITCWHCNAAIKKVGDNWKVAQAIAKYLKYWQEEQGWDYVLNQRSK